MAIFVVVWPRLVFNGNIRVYQTYLHRCNIRKQEQEQLTLRHITVQYSTGKIFELKMRALFVHEVICKLLRKLIRRPDGINLLCKNCLKNLVTLLR